MRGPEKDYVKTTPTPIGAGVVFCGYFQKTTNL